MTGTLGRQIYWHFYSCKKISKTLVNTQFNQLLGMLATKNTKYTKKFNQFHALTMNANLLNIILLIVINFTIAHWAITQTGDVAMELFF